MKISDRIIDVERREEGAWVENIPEWGNLKLRVRGVGNKDWARLEQKLTAAVPRAQKVNGMDPAERSRINNVLLRDCSLIDWANLEDGDVPVPYSKEAANKYLTDPKYEQFRDAVWWAAMVVAEQGKTELEEDAKN